VTVQIEPLRMAPALPETAVSGVAIGAGVSSASSLEDEPIERRSGHRDLVLSC
jgi:hypothetical protein